MKKLAATVSGRSNFSPKFETFLSKKINFDHSSNFKVRGESRNSAAIVNFGWEMTSSGEKKDRKSFVEIYSPFDQKNFLLSILPSNERTKHSFNNSNVISLWFKMGSRKSINTVCIIWFFIWYFYQNCSWASAAETTKTNWKLFDSIFMKNVQPRLQKMYVEIETWLK